MREQGKQLACGLSRVILGTMLMASLLLTSSYVQAEEGNQVFFRGGAAFATNDRANEVFTDVFGTFGTGATQDDSDSGYYVGAGVELLLSKDVWGMMSGVSVLGEIGLEFKRFGSNEVPQAVPSTARAAFGLEDPITTDEVQITMLTVNVAPKLKFREGSRFRPWIIPVGLDFNVISPPSDNSTVLDIGAQFGVGFEYRVWKAFNVGVDGRFHLASGQTNTVNDFGTIGAYVGIAF